MRTALIGMVVCCMTTSVARADARAPGHGGHVVHWGYGKGDGPAHWAELSPEYGVCASGKAQTPIDIDPTTARNAPGGAAPTFELVPGEHPLQEFNNGHTVQVNDAGASVLRLGAARYELAQFHFHAPSEHTLAGKSFPMEIHLVHKSADGRLAVLGILVQEGAANTELTPVFEHLPAQIGEPAGLEQSLDLAALVPKSRAVFRYEGSLTTPPCSEHVDWTVFEQPITLSREQISAFSALIGDDHRPVQPRNGRVISRSELAVR